MTQHARYGDDEYDFGGPHLAAFLDALGCDPDQHTSHLVLRHIGAGMFTVEVRRIVHSDLLADAVRAAKEVEEQM